MATKKRAPLKTTPPFGYGDIVVLQRTDRVLLPAPAGTPEFCRSTNALALSVGEFSVAARDYPIVFAQAGGAGTYSPVVVLGLADRQNLFVDATGQWEAATYVPAFVRRYPFCVSRIDAEGGQGNRKVVCVASTHLDRKGVRLFDATGKATPRWQAAERLLLDYENDLDATARMCALFAELDLFAPFAFEVTRTPGLKLQGMHRIDEEKLKALKPDTHKSLVTQGLMSRIYGHLHSLENFARLYQRAVARARVPVKRKRKQPCTATRRSRRGIH